MDGILAETKESFSELTLIAIEAALLAGDLLRQGFGSPFAISSKEGRHNLVTEYDHRCEKAILAYIQQHKPHSHFLAEESGASGSPQEELLWIIDPLDGTVNFAHQIPIFSVSIAAQIASQTVCGVIYQPITQELFIAEKGKGAFLNGKKLQVSPVPKIEEAILATGFPYNLAKNPHHCIEHFVEILRQGIPIRRLGSAAIDLAYTAAGRFEGFFEVQLSPWDCAAGNLLVEEAGGKVTHWDGQPYDLHKKSPILASNGKVHAALSKILEKRTP